MMTLHDSKSPSIDYDNLDTVIASLSDEQLHGLVKKLGNLPEFLRPHLPETFVSSQGRPLRYRCKCGELETAYSTVFFTVWLEHIQKVVLSKLLEEG